MFQEIWKLHAFQQYTDNGENINNAQELQ